MTPAVKFWDGDWSDEDFKHCPMALLVWIIKKIYRGDHRMRHVSKHNIEGAIQEARRRGMDNYFIENLDPSRCACGGKGLYIVGTTTYCRKCKEDGKHRAKLNFRNRIFEIRAASHEKEWKPVERSMKNHDRAVRTRVRRKRHP